MTPFYNISEYNCQEGSTPSSVPLRRRPQIKRNEKKTSSSSSFCAFFARLFPCCNGGRGYGDNSSRNSNGNALSRAWCCCFRSSDGGGGGGVSVTTLASLLVFFTLLATSLTVGATLYFFALDDAESSARTATEILMEKTKIRIFTLINSADYLSSSIQFSIRAQEGYPLPTEDPTPIPEDRIPSWPPPPPPPPPPFPTSGDVTPTPNANYSTTGFADDDGNTNNNTESARTAAAVSAASAREAWWLKWQTLTLTQARFSELQVIRFGFEDGTRVATLRAGGANSPLSKTIYTDLRVPRQDLLVSTSTLPAAATATSTATSTATPTRGLSVEVGSSVAGESTTTTTVPAGREAMFDASSSTSLPPTSFSSPSSTVSGGAIKVVRVDRVDGTFEEIALPDPFGDGGETDAGVPFITHWWHIHHHKHKSEGEKDADDAVDTHAAGSVATTVQNNNINSFNSDPPRRRVYAASHHENSLISLAPQSSLVFPSSIEVYYTKSGDEIFKFQRNDSYDPRTQAFYNRQMKLFERRWSPVTFPALYGIPIIRHTFALYNGSGTFLGVGEMQLRLSSLTQLTASRRPTKGTHVFVLDHKDNIVVTSTARPAFTTELVPFDYDIVGPHDHDDDDGHTHITSTAASPSPPQTTAPSSSSSSNDSSSGPNPREGGEEEEDQSKEEEDNRWAIDERCAISAVNQQYPLAPRVLYCTRNVASFGDTTLQHVCEKVPRETDETLKYHLEGGREYFVMSKMVEFSSSWQKEAPPPPRNNASATPVGCDDRYYDHDGDADADDPDDDDNADSSRTLLQWRVVVVIPADEIMASARKGLTTALAMAAAMLVIVIAIVCALLRILLKPLDGIIREMTTGAYLAEEEEEEEGEGEDDEEEAEEGDDLAALKYKDCPDGDEFSQDNNNNKNQIRRRGATATGADCDAADETSMVLMATTAVEASPLEDADRLKSGTNSASRFDEKGDDALSRKKKSNNKSTDKKNKKKSAGGRHSFSSSSSPSSASFAPPPRTLSYLKDVAAIQQAYWRMADELRILRGYIPEHICDQLLKRNQQQQEEKMATKGYSPPPPLKDNANNNNYSNSDNNAYNDEKDPRYNTTTSTSSNALGDNDRNGNDDNDMMVMDELYEEEDQEAMPPLPPPEAMVVFASGGGGGGGDDFAGEAAPFDAIAPANNSSNNNNTATCADNNNSLAACGGGEGKVTAAGLGSSNLGGNGNGNGSRRRWQEVEVVGKAATGGAFCGGGGFASHATFGITTGGGSGGAAGGCLAGLRAASGSSSRSKKDGSATMSGKAPTRSEIAILDRQHREEQEKKKKLLLQQQQEAKKQRRRSKRSLLFHTNHTAADGEGGAFGAADGDGNDDDFSDREWDGGVDEDDGGEEGGGDAVSEAFTCMATAGGRQGKEEGEEEGPSSLLPPADGQCNVADSLNATHNNNNNNNNSNSMEIELPEVVVVADAGGTEEATTTSQHATPNSHSAQVVMRPPTTSRRQQQDQNLHCQNDDGGKTNKNAQRQDVNNLTAAISIADEHDDRRNAPNQRQSTNNNGSNRKTSHQQLPVATATSMKENKNVNEDLESQFEFRSCPTAANQRDDDILMRRHFYSFHDENNGNARRVSADGHQQQNQLTTQQQPTSSAACLENNLTGRYISVVVINIVGFHAYAATTPAARIAKDHEAVVAFIHDAAKRCGGVLDTFSGDKFWVSFNATSKCDEHALAATLCACEVAGVLNREAATHHAYQQQQMLFLQQQHDNKNSNHTVKAGGEKMPPPPVLRFGAAIGGATAGVTTGKAFVGPLGTRRIRRHTIISSCMPLAAALERLASRYPDCGVMVGGDMIPAIEGYFQYLLLDAIALPGSGGKRRRIASVKGPMMPAHPQKGFPAHLLPVALAGFGSPQLPTTSPYADANACLNAFLEGRRDEVATLLQKIAVQIEQSALYHQCGPAALALALQQQKEQQQQQQQHAQAALIEQQKAAGGDHSRSPPISSADISAADVTLLPAAAPNPQPQPLSSSASPLDQQQQPSSPPPPPQLLPSDITILAPHECRSISLAAQGIAMLSQQTDGRLYRNPIGAIF